MFDSLGRVFFFFFTWQLLIRKARARNINFHNITEQNIRIT